MGKIAIAILLWANIALGQADFALLALSSGGAPVEDPTSFTNLMVWWRADAAGNYADTDPVGVVTNSANTFFNLTNFGSARPLYTANFFGTAPALHFDTTDDGLQTSNAVALLDSANMPWTLMLIGKITGAGGVNAFNNPSVNRQLIRLAQVATNTVGFFNGSDTFDPAVGNDLTNKFMVVIQFTNSLMKVWNNLNTNANNTLSASGTLTVSQFGSYAVFGTFDDWYFGEFALWTNHFLTANSITNLYNTYAKPKYGLP